MSDISFPRFVFLFLGIVFFAGCTASQPTSLYVLTTDISGGGPKGSTIQSKACPRVELGSVSFPQYLDRSEIMTRVGPNRLSLSELHHWAEPLRENFVRVLTANLNSRLCDGATVVVSERERIPSDYRLRVNVQRFEPLDRNKALLTASWTLLDTASGRSLCARRGVYETQVQGTDHQAVAAAMSKALASLSRDIADAFRELSKDSPS